MKSKSKLPASGFQLSDPAHGLLEYRQEEFIKAWIGNNADKNTFAFCLIEMLKSVKFIEQKTTSKII